MTLHEFVSRVAAFPSLSAPEKILHFGWYLHRFGNRETFDQKDVRTCFEKENMQVPNLSREFTRLLERKPRVLLKDGGSFRLEHTIRLSFDKKYGEHETTIALSQLLKELPGKIADEAERLFLTEAIICYQHKAFRAAIVMTWNLAYDHFVRWILTDSVRLAAFNSSIVKAIGPKRGSGLTMAKREDFEDLKEHDVVNIAGVAGLFSSNNTKKILEMQLTKRNMAAHPSLVRIEGPQADDTISSLVNNIVLTLQ